jgi:hypothetical protein
LIVAVESQSNPRMSRWPPWSQVVQILACAPEFRPRPHVALYNLWCGRFPELGTKQQESKPPTGALSRVVEVRCGLVSAGRFLICRSMAWAHAGTVQRDAACVYNDDGKPFASYESAWCAHLSRIRRRPISHAGENGSDRRGGCLPRSAGTN